MSVTPDFSVVSNAIANQVRGDVDSLHELNKSIRAASGDSSKIKELIETSTVAEVVTQREQVAKIKAKLREIEDNLTKWAVSQAAPADFDVNEAKASFKESRKTVVAFLKNGIATINGLGGDASELEELLSNLPGTTAAGTHSNGRSPEEMLAIREWAKENGFDVSERGRISAKVYEAYDAAKNEGFETPAAE